MHEAIDKVWKQTYDSCLDLTGLMLVGLKFTIYCLVSFCFP